MLHILTGEDAVSSRKKLSELLLGCLNVVRLDGKKATIAEIDTAFVSNSMFSEKKTIVIEGFTKIKSERFIEILKQFQDDSNTDVILWDEASLPAKIRNSLKSAESFSFEFPKVYFQFMDSLSPSGQEALSLRPETLRVVDRAGGPKSLELLREVLKTYEAEQILYSIIKRLRQLMVLKSENYFEFSEFAKMQDWQLGKLKSQANKWSEAQLKTAFIEYAALDERIKTGGLTMDLSSHLDILLLSDLN